MVDRALVFDLIGRDKSLGRTLDAAERKGKRFGSSVLSVTKMLAGPAALGGVAIAAAKVWHTFDDASDKIRVRTGATGKTLKGLEQDFASVYKSVPGSAEDASTAIADLNVRTGQSGKGLQALAKQELNLARITKTDLGENVAATTRLFRDWSIPTSKQASTLDELFRASQATGAGVTDLAVSVVQFGSPLRQLGFNLAETTALFGEFERAGVVTETVLPGLKMALKNYALAHKDPQKALIETIKRIKESSTTAQANTIAFQTFGARAGPDLAAAIREGHFDLANLIATIKGGSDTINKASADTLDWNDKLELIRKKLEVFAAPALSGAFDVIGEKITALETFARKNLIPKLGELKTKWDENRDSILALLNPLGDVSDKFSSADANAQKLVDSGATIVDAVGKASRALTAMGDALNIAAATSTLWALHTRSAGITAAIGIVTAGGTIAQAVDNMAVGFLTFVKHTLGIFDPSIRRSAQAGIDAFRGWRDKTRKNVDDTVAKLGAARRSIATDIRMVQNTINGLHGKTVKVKVDWEHPHAGLAGLSVKIVGGPSRKGRRLPGYGGGDRIPLLAEAGETVVSKEHSRLPFMRAAFEAAGVPGYRGGGAVGTAHYFEQMQRDMGPLAERLGIAWGRVLRKLGGGSAGIKAFIRSTDPLPYIWGGVGPGGYDCSGLTGEVLNRMQRRPSYHRRFTTASNFGAVGFKPGAGGVYTIGVNAAGGHMVGRYGGLAFEAANTAAGIRIGGAARSVSSMPQQYHMAKGGLVEAMRTVDWLARQGAVIGGDPAHLRVLNMDRGGALRPGWNPPIYNGTGRPEPVGIDYKQLAKALGDELRANPPQIVMDGRRLDRALSSAAIPNARNR